MKVVCLFQMSEFQMSEILMQLAHKIAIALYTDGLRLKSFYWALKLLV